MKAIFYAVSLVVILAAAFFSYGIMNNFEEQQAAIDETQQRSKAIRSRAEDVGAEAKEALENLGTARSERAVVEQSIAKLESDKQGLDRDLAEVGARLEEQEATLEDARQAIVQAEAALRELDIEGPVDMDTIGDTITGLEDQKKALVQELEELETTVAGAEQAVESSRERLASLARRKAERSARFRQNAMESIVTAVDQEWGFVVIGAGRNAGFRPQTRLVVERDGRRIAEVNPSSIEASQTIAEIDFDTMAPGAMIQPGDRVILARTASN